MSNIKLAKPSIVFGYWRPWNEDSHLIDSYLDYARDVTLTKYGADIVGKYVSMASREQVLAINSLGQKIGLGMNVLSNQMAGISNQMVGISDQMTVVIDELNFLNKNIDIMVEQQHLTNLLLEDISKLLRIPDREKERQQNILHGIKFFVNAEKDPDLFDDALEELLCAEQLMKQDYFVLHRIGLIYLHAHKHINPKKALDYFTRAAKYASVESDPDAVRLVNSLTNHDKSDIKYLAAESYENAAFAAYILGDFELAVANQSKALNFQTTPQNRFLYAKYLARNKQIKECIENLDIAIKKLPALALAVFKEIDLTNEPEVLDLVEQFVRRQEEERKRQEEEERKRQEEERKRQEEEERKRQEEEERKYEERQNQIRQAEEENSIKNKLENIASELKEKDKSSGSTIWVKNNIPIKKIQNFSKSYGDIKISEEEAYFFYDSTIFGSGKQGILITEDNLYYNQPFQSHKKGFIPIQDIKTFSIGDSAFLNCPLIINSNEIGIFISVLKEDFIKIFSKLIDSVKSESSSQNHNTKKISNYEDRPVDGLQTYRIDDNYRWFGIIINGNPVSGGFLIAQDGSIYLGEMELLGKEEGQIRGSKISSTEYEIISTVSDKIYKIGAEGPAGGRIIYDMKHYDLGWRYIEMAPEDLNGLFPGLYVESHTSCAVGSAKYNTLKLVSIIGDDGNAARACMNYIHNGYKDWYLPSIYELELLCKVSSLFNSEENQEYLSSSTMVKRRSLIELDYTYRPPLDLFPHVIDERISGKPYKESFSLMTLNIDDPGMRGTYSGEADDKIITMKNSNGRRSIYAVRPIRYF